MTTLQGHHPLIAIRTRSRQPASLLSVVLIAAVTLAAAVALALVTEDDGSPVPSASSPAAESPAQSSAPARAGVLTPRVTEAVPQQAPARPGVRYDGGPEEGSAFVDRIPPSTRYDGGPEEGTRGGGVAPTR
jgi:hypothetical protein